MLRIINRTGRFSGVTSCLTPERRATVTLLGTSFLPFPRRSPGLLPDTATSLHLARKNTDSTRCDISEYALPKLQEVRSWRQAVRGIRARNCLPLHQSRT